MEKFKYKTSAGSSEIFIGRDWKEVGSIIPIEQTVIICDSNIYKYYSADFPQCKVLKLEPGEVTKSLSTIEELVRELLKLEADRSYFLLGIGGGVVGDICGLVASVYMRGISFGLVSTSLLSQVDASTGGKNGVNTDGYKNVIGCFKQPDFVICDTSMLRTLPGDEFKSGLAEIVKHALIRDYKLFEYLEKEAENIGPENTSLMDDLVKRSVKIKVEIVENDEKESGERRLLNFGHTIGHAIESVYKLKHGLAVAQGIFFALLLSVDQGYLSEEKADRALKLMRSLGLLTEDPVMLPSFADSVRRDKKRDKDIIHFVLLKDIGEAVIKDIPVNELQSWMGNRS